MITSLEELSKMEEQRRREEAESRARESKLRAEEAERAAAAARESAAAREAANHEARLRTAVTEAQIEAEKRARIEQSKMAVQLRLQAESIAQHEAHARELAAIVEARQADDRKSRARTIGIVLACATVISAAIAVVWVTRPSKVEPAPVAPTVAAPHDDSAERTIGRLEKEIERLRAAASAVAPPAPTVSASAPPTIHPQPKATSTSGGTKCPPGVHGIPLCP